MYKSFRSDFKIRIRIIIYGVEYHTFYVYICYIVGTGIVFFLYFFILLLLLLRLKFKMRSCFLNKKFPYCVFVYCIHYTVCCRCALHSRYTFIFYFFFLLLPTLKYKYQNCNIWQESWICERDAWTTCVLISLVYCLNMCIRSIFIRR